LPLNATQWQDLHGFLRRLENPLAAEPDDDARPTEEERLRRNRIALNENPTAVSWYVSKRWQRFFSIVLRPFFRLVDYWHRWEWQARGSGHTHDLGWPEGAPDLSSMPEDLREAAVCEFWGPMLSAINPDVDRPRAIPHPSAVGWDEREPTNARLAELLNCFQRHAKHSDYCLRKPKKQQEKVCGTSRMPADPLRSAASTCRGSRRLPITPSCLSRTAGRRTSRCATTARWSSTAPVRRCPGSRTWP